MSFPTTNTIIDNFNRADGAIDTSWLLAHSYAGSTLMVTSGSQAAPSAGNYIIIYWSGGSYGPDMEGYVVEPTLTAVTNDGPYLCARLQQIGTGTLDGYLAAIETSGTRTFAGRLDNGVLTTLGAVGATSFSNGVTLGIETTGSTINVYAKPSGGSWSLVLSRGDATYSSTSFLGMYGGSDSTTYRMDDFGGGTIIVPGGMPPERLLIQQAVNRAGTY